MNFHLEFTPRKLPETICHPNKIFLIGSCFTENIGSKLKQYKFSVMENPNGILFNPLSIAHSISSYVKDHQYTEADLFYENECWNSWDHHSRFSHHDEARCLLGINQSQQLAHGYLRNADWLMITLGSAFVYELENSRVVANCHKVPTDKFNKRLVPAAEITEALLTTLRELFRFNPNIKVIFTISPVRHLRDGFVENNRSKAALIQAVHNVIEETGNTFYFPAYELVIDDLRDYRFYAEDMVHPNYGATNYVWEKFIATCMDDNCQQLMKEINTINAARSHTPFNPHSLQHKKFLHTHFEKIIQLNTLHPYINFEEEKRYFRP